jgi:hypothetical protein
MVRTGPKPIEGHLIELGFNAALLSDDDRRAIAQVVIDALDKRTGTVVRRLTGDFHRVDPQRTRVILVALDRPRSN